MNTKIELRSSSIGGATLKLDLNIFMFKEKDYEIHVAREIIRALERTMGIRYSVKEGPKQDSTEYFWVHLESGVVGGPGFIAIWKKPTKDEAWV